MRLWYLSHERTAKASSSSLSCVYEQRSLQHNHAQARALLIYVLAHIILLDETLPRWISKITLHEEGKYSAVPLQYTLAGLLAHL